MKQGSSHRRTVSENQELFDTKQRRLDYQSTTWAPVVGWRQVNIINAKDKNYELEFFENYQCCKEQ